MERRTLVNVVAFLVFLFGAVNFGAWLKESLDLGGNALSGEVRDGHYLVANKGHYVEVTPEEWERSRIHTQSILVTQPLMLVALTYLVVTAARSRARNG